MSDADKFISNKENERETMTRLEKFLTGRIKDSVMVLTDKVITAMEGAIDGGKEFNPSLVLRVVAVVRVLGLVGMERDLKLFSALVFSLYCDKGVEIPDQILRVISPIIGEVLVTAPSTAPRQSTSTMSAGTPKPQVLLTPPHSSTQKNGDFAEKFGAAAQKLGLATPLSKLHDVLKKDRSGVEYWNNCKTLLSQVLEGAFFKELADWEPLITKMKKDLFFFDRHRSGLFFEQCPKEQMTELVLGDGGLHELVGKIKTETVMSPESISQISFVIDSCVLIGPDAKEVLINAKQAVNRMRQLNFISPDHWLAKKVSAMKPQQKRVGPALSAEKAQESQTKDPVEGAQPSSSNETLDRVGGKEKLPAVQDSVAEQAFQRQMLTADKVNGAPVPVLEPAPDKEGVSAEAAVTTA